jgi:hypothetical protein
MEDGSDGRYSGCFERNTAAYFFAVEWSAGEAKMNCTITAHEIEKGSAAVG